MHAKAVKNNQIHAWTGGKSPLQYELFKCDSSNPQNVVSTAAGSTEDDESSSCSTSYPSRDYTGGKKYRPQQHVAGKRFMKEIPPDNPLTIENIRRGHNLANSKLPFLWKLHEMLDDVEKTGDQHIVSWFEHGRSFRVHKPKSFVQKIIPYYFNQSKYKSFQRQLHLYEFTRITRGPEAGAYSHPKFIRGIKSLCMSLSPKKIKGKGSKKRVQESLPSTGIWCQNLGQTQPLMTSNYTTAQASVTSDGSIKDEMKIDRIEREQQAQLRNNSSEWMKKLRGMLVTGATLAAELEEKSREGSSVIPPPHQGDMVYVFGGMPFRYMECNDMPLLDDVSEDGTSCDQSENSEEPPLLW